MPRIVNRLRPDDAADEASLVEGLLAEPASIAPKYFYDALGCALFGAICELEEYYPTRTEAGIFEAHRDAIVDALGRRRQLVDLGAADCRKGGAWLAHLRPTRYVAVDIAGEVLGPSLARLAADHPEIDMTGVVTDFSRALDLGAELAAGPTTFFYAGSSIGNFTPAQAQRFLRAIRDAASEDGNLLIGVDTKKDAARLNAAYDDALGVTAAFNRNALRHVNRVLGSDFDLAAFAHRGFYNAAEGRIEMHLEALSEQRVRWPGHERTFRRGERIHTENSYKYAPDEFAALLRRAGFGQTHCWLDPAGDFSVFAAR